MMLNPILGLVTKIVAHIYYDFISYFLSKYDYFHIHMDFVIL